MYKPSKEHHLETTAIRTQIERTQFLEHSNPLYLTSSYIFEDAEYMRASFADETERNIYSRYTNPNSSEFVEKICQMEGAERGYAFATGMSAVFSTFVTLLDWLTILCLVKIFCFTQTSLNNSLPKWNISTSYFRINEIERIESLIQPNTKILYAESPTNPVIDSCGNNEQVREVGLKCTINQSKRFQKAGVILLHYYSIG